MPPHYKPEEIRQLRQYCEEERQLGYIEERMKRTPGAISRLLWVLAKRDQSWRPYARRYSKEYDSFMALRPLLPEDADSLVRYLMETPRATVLQAEEAGHRKALKRYPGGIARARRDAESRRFTKAYDIYSAVVNDITTAAMTTVRSDLRSVPELRLVEKVFGKVPCLDVERRAEDLAGRYVRQTPLAADLGRYKVDAVASVRDVFRKDAAAVLEGGVLRRLIETALETLSPKERTVIEMRYLDGSRTLKEIGGLPEFNVTDKRISNIEAKALSKLRRPQTVGAIRDHFMRTRVDSVDGLQHRAHELGACGETG